MFKETRLGSNFSEIIKTLIIIRWVQKSAKDIYIIQKIEAVDYCCNAVVVLFVI